jgi:hypothetical protein
MVPTGSGRCLSTSISTITSNLTTQPRSTASPPVTGTPVSGTSGGRNRPPRTQLQAGRLESDPPQERHEPAMRTAHLQYTRRRQPILQERAQPVDAALRQVQAGPTRDGWQLQILFLMREPVLTHVQTGLGGGDPRDVVVRSDRTHQGLACRTPPILRRERDQSRLATPAAQLLRHATSLAGFMTALRFRRNGARSVARPTARAPTPGRSVRHGDMVYRSHLPNRLLALRGIVWVGL